MCHYMAPLFLLLLLGPALGQDDLVVTTADGPALGQDDLVVTTADGPALGQDDLVVTTADGPVMGSYKFSEKGARFRSFQGIPFAAPPVGPLRFAPPQPAAPWEDVLDVSGDTTIECPQYDTYANEQGMSGQEDCLYLTVYSPPSASPDNPLPVMLWIPGGYWVFGSNHYDLYGPMHFLERDVVFVSVNHRLGTLGWMSFGIPEAPGNQGVLDNIAALKWVQTNIAAFGGDPNSVTVFGMSSGAWSTSYLHLSPLAKGLYHRAIMQSGSLLNPFWLWRTQHDGLLQSDWLADGFQCPDVTTPQAKLECLQAANHEDIVNAGNIGDPSNEFLGQVQHILRPNGIIDGEFLPAAPHHMMEAGDYNHVDLMLGMTDGEGLNQAVNFLKHPELFTAAKFLWDTVFGPFFLFGRYGSDITEEDVQLAHILTEYYLGTGGSILNFDMAHFDNITDMITDAYIWYGSHNHAKWAASHGDNVYKYMFRFKGTYGQCNWAYGLDNSKFRVAHSDELWYQWHPYYRMGAVAFTPEEQVVSDTMLDMWTNFAKYGDPTPPGWDGTTWEPMTEDNQHYLVIDNEMRMELSETYTDRMAVWEENYKYPEGDSIPGPIPPWQPPK